MKDAQLREIEIAARALTRGRLVVFPTETVYGLGANALSPAAVEKIYQAKGRPADNPLIVHIAHPDQLKDVARVVFEEAYALFASFSPGPLTVVLPAAPNLAPQVSAGLATVAVRIPSHPVAHRLLSVAGIPVAAPSANRSGEPSPTTVEMSRQSLGERVSIFLDGGPCQIGVESTVVLVEPGRALLLRPGAITADQIQAALPNAVVTAAETEQRLKSSPGTRHRHYRPAARVILFDPSQADEAAESPVFRLPEGVSRERFGVIRSVGFNQAQLVPSTIEAECRFFRSSEEYARELYRWFVEFDAYGCTTIVAELPRPLGIGVAVRDRLFRAAGD